MNKEQLNEKNLNDLKVIAKDLGLKNLSKYKKSELIDLIVESQPTPVSIERNGSIFGSSIPRTEQKNSLTEMVNLL